MAKKKIIKVDTKPVFDNTVEGKTVFLPTLPLQVPVPENPKEHTDVDTEHYEKDTPIATLTDTIIMLTLKNGVTITKILTSDDHDKEIEDIKNDLKEKGQL